MPNIRIMNWNVEQLSWTKITINTMPQTLARVIVSNDIDILVLLELRSVNADAILTLLTQAMNAVAPAANYYWLKSEVTGREHYGFVIRDIAVIRPLRFAPTAGQPTGTSASPLKSLHAGNWFVWPAAGGPAVPKPSVPLVDMYVTPRRSRGVKRSNFAGGAAAGNLPGGAIGSRAPCLALFTITGAAGAQTLLPLVVCHYGAVRSGRNPLGQMQISQLQYLHISQLFSTYDTTAAGPPPPHSGFLTVDGAAVGVQNIVFTGDFNVDFLVNDAAGAALAATNRNALDSLTPTAAAGGSAAPAAAAAAAGAAPVVPPPPGPLFNTVPPQRLRAACTTRGTMLKKYTIAPPLPVATLDLRGAAFDNFFYGGAQTISAAPAFGIGNVDSGNIVDVPANIVQAAPGAAGQIYLRAIRQHYVALGTKNAANAPALAAIGALTVRQRWIGARLVSDHLPVVLDFVCP